jgi:hypothetical protein
VKYFFAVVRPVMGERAPSVKSLPDIVNRQKLFQQNAMNRAMRKFERYT